jgi:hypothetical protein
LNKYRVSINENQKVTAWEDIRHCFTIESEDSKKDFKDKLQTFIKDLQDSGTTFNLEDELLEEGYNVSEFDSNLEHSENIDLISSVFTDLEVSHRTK